VPPSVQHLLWLPPKNRKTISVGWLWKGEDTLKSRFTLDLRARDIQMNWLVKKAKMVHVHFALDLERMRAQRNMNEWKIYTTPTWQQVDNVSWSIGYCVRPIKNRWIQHNTRGHGSQFNYPWLIEYYNTMAETQIQTYITVPQHGPFPLYTKLWGPICSKIGFIISHNKVKFGWLSRALRFSWSWLWVRVYVRVALNQTST
jgi:hypothetical protein